MYADDQKAKGTDALATAIAWLKARNDKEKLAMGIVAGVMVNEQTNREFVEL